MKFIILQENLEHGLSVINHLVSQKPQLPILNHILIKTTKDSLFLLATDLEMGMKMSLGAKIEKVGEIAIPGRIFLDLVSNLPAGKITITVDKQVVLIETPKTKSQILGMDGGEFPKIFEEEKEFFGEIDRETLKKIITRLYFASSNDEGRPVLTGIRVEIDDGMIMVATDGYRLSVQKREDASFKKRESPILIPAKLFKQLLLFLAEKGEVEKNPVNFYLSKTKNQILITLNGNTLVGRLIEGEFPDYEKVIPTSKNTEAVLDREEFFKAVKTCAIFARESANIVRMKLNKDGITLSANSPQVGENTVFLDAQVTGEDNEIAFNSRFLLDFLSNVDAQELVFEMTGPLNPGVFKIKDDDSFLHIIMPVRIQAETTSE